MIVGQPTGKFQAKRAKGNACVDYFEPTEADLWMGGFPIRLVWLTCSIIFLPILLLHYGRSRRLLFLQSIGAQQIVRQGKPQHYCPDLLQAAYQT